MGAIVGRTRKDGSKQLPPRKKPGELEHKEDPTSAAVIDCYIAESANLRLDRDHHRPI
jgi:hypothetical protein